MKASSWTAMASVFEAADDPDAAKMCRLKAAEQSAIEFVNASMGLPGPKPDGFTFATLRNANIKRLPSFKNALGKPAHANPDGSDWSLLEWAGSACGEAGEAANVAKKIRRGDYANRADGIAALGEEIADAVIYLDILATQAGLELGDVVMKKWNKTSAKIGYPIRIMHYGVR